MRNLGKSLVIVTAALVMLAIAASAASAQTLLATDETSGNHCPAVSISGSDVNGGCLAHYKDEEYPSWWSWFKHFIGIETKVTECDTETSARLDEDGNGYMLEQVFTGAGCARQACKNGSGEAIPWPVSSSETGSGTARMTITFCVEPVGGGTDEVCEVDAPLYEGSPGSHEHELGGGAEMTGHGSACEVLFHWKLERFGVHDGASEQAVEIVHT